MKIPQAVWGSQKKKKKKINYHLSLQRVIIFLLVEGLKLFKNYQNVTQRQEVSKCCWEKYQ